MGASFAVTALTVKILSSRGGNGGRQRRSHSCPRETRLCSGKAVIPEQTCLGPASDLAVKSPLAHPNVIHCQRNEFRIKWMLRNCSA
jgi:hypothetical protein